MKPLIMGILNITPDSFFDGGKFYKQDDAKKQIEKMLSQKVDIIDVGAFSSRPGSDIPSISEEKERLLPILSILQEYNIPISVDTYRYEVVKDVLQYKNIHYINDISGLSDERILPLLQDSGVGYILMHTQGTPKNMQDNPKYNNIIEEILDFFTLKTKILHKNGIKNIVLDPGFGFGKSLEDNYTIIKNTPTLKELGFPLLYGTSRKSMMYKLLNTTPDDILPETIGLSTHIISLGVDILRVHDVKEHVNMRKIHSFLI